jgi:hypothetical protein
MESNRRDRLVQGVRAARWATGLGAAGLTAAFSVAAAHAFKGHDGHKAAAAAPAARNSSQARHRVTVPGPDNVPAIATDGSLQAPQQAPQAAPQEQQAPQQQAPAPQQQAPQQQAAPPVSGGS